MAEKSDAEQTKNEDVFSALFKGESLRKLDNIRGHIGSITGELPDRVFALEVIFGIGGHAISKASKGFHHLITDDSYHRDQKGLVIRVDYSLQKQWAKRGKKYTLGV